MGQAVILDTNSSRIADRSDMKHKGLSDKARFFCLKNWRDGGII